MTFLFRVSFPCILLDILSLSRLCGRLSPFLRNLRTNRKLAYYTQLQLSAYAIKIAMVRDVTTRHIRMWGEVRIDYDDF